MKTGLVLEGGASRGYFTVGVLDALYDMGFKADLLVGTSAGIANGVSFVSGQRGRNLEIALRYLPDKRYMGIRHLLNPKNRSLYNLKFVFNDLPNKYAPFDYDAFDNSGCTALAALTNLKTGKCEFHKVKSSDKEWKTVIASCALPLLFQPVEIDGELYLDGGITVPIPVDKAIEDGCDKIVVVTTREREYVKDEESAVKIVNKLYKKHPEFTEAMTARARKYNENHAHVLELEKEGRIIHIAPEISTASWKRTERGNKAIQAMYDEGYKTAMKYKNLITEKG